MKYSVVKCVNVEDLRPLVLQWGTEADNEPFGLRLDESAMMSSLDEMLDRPDALILMLLLDGNPVGFMGLLRLVSEVGHNQRLANEHFWFVEKHQIHLRYV